MSTCECPKCCYDYIIIGAGAAGSVVAARLAENKNTTILVLEEGPNNTFNPTNNTITPFQKSLIATPGLAPNLWFRYVQNPAQPGCEGLEASPVHLEFATVKEFTRYYTVSRGNGAGGSTAHHLMVDGRGSATVYDDIAKAVDDPRWAYCNILPYYKKMETYYPPTPCPQIHGFDGWLQIKNTELEADFTEQFLKVVTNLGVPYREDPSIPTKVAGVYRTHAQINNDTGTRSYAYHDLLQPILNTQNNVTVKFGALVKKIIFDTTIKNKSSKANKPYKNNTQCNTCNTSRDNLSRSPKPTTKNICDCNICKQERKKLKVPKNKSKSAINKKPRAIGVKVYRKHYLMEVDTTGNKVVTGEDGCIAILPNKNLPRYRKFYARKEVIVCAGTFNTPQILMLSGIGDRHKLESLDIDVVSDLPAVGQNLMDHQEVNVIYELDPTKFMWGWQAQLLLPNIDQVPPNIQPIVLKYANPASMNNIPVPLIWDWYSKANPPCPPNCRDPDVHVHVAATFFFDFNLTFIRPPGDDLHIVQTAKDTYLPDRNNPTSPNGIPGEKARLLNSQLDPSAPRVFLDFLMENLKVKATGSVTINSKDPRKSPIIELGLWEDEKTHKRLAKMLLQIRDVMNTPEMRQFAINPDDYSTFELYPGVKADTLESIKQYIKVWQSFGHHASGTSKMGSDDDPNAVVDSQLRVRGVDGLRVVDLSVYPTPHLHAYNPSRGVYLIAEVASDIIKQANGENC